MQTIKRLLRYILQTHRRLLLYSLLLALAALLVRLPTPYFTKIIIDQVLPEADRSLLSLLLVLTLILGLIGVVLRYAESYVGTILNNRIGKSVASEFYRHIFRLPFAFYDQWRTGDLLSRAGDARSSIMSMTSAITSTALSLLQLLIFPAILLYISWKLALLALLVYPLDAWVCIKINRILYKRSVAAAEAQADYSSKSFEFIAAMKQLQAMNIEARARREIDYYVDRSIDAAISRDRVRFGGSAISGLIQTFGNFILLWLGWHWVLVGRLTIGDLIAFSAYAAFLHGPLTSMFELSRQMQNVIVAGRRFHTVADTPEDRQIVAGRSLSADECLQPIEFHGVSFSYDGSPLVVRDLNLRISPRSITAITGKNGSGKTTLVSMIPRFYVPQKGRITLGGQDLQTIDLSSLRSHICYVTQNSVLFRGSLYEQLTLGVDNPDESRIAEVVSIVGLDELVRTSDLGLHRALGEKGVGLSAGQQQRVLLARALLLDKPIVILDEATSALDVETEVRLIETLRELRSSRTFLIISHRPSAYEMADHIVELTPDRAT